MVNKIILGGGISGLVYAFYNKEYKVISDSFGGQMLNYFNLGPRYLHATIWSEKFLNDLGLPIEEQVIKTGYQINKIKFVDIMLDIGYKKEYYMKSRGIKDLTGFDETAMSEGKNTFKALKVDFTKVIEKLVIACQSRLIQDKVTLVDVKAKTISLQSGQVLSYDELINTMPLNIFSGLLLGADDFPKSESFKASPMTYVLLKPQPSKGFNYLYVPQINVKHHRLTWDDKGLVADIFGIWTPEQLKKIYRDEYVDSKILYNAQIIPYVGELRLDGVKFLGRYGKWDRHYKTEKIIEEAIKESLNGN